jgi:pimeloyl-ACP methyl ester carboxylesterase
MQMGRIAVVALAAVVGLAGCGGGGESFPSKATADGPLGKGADAVWVFRPAEKPKSVVIFFHGQGGRVESTPANHRPWIDHLVSRGTAVVYPRWEVEYERAVVGHVAAGVQRAVDEFGLADLPAMVIGYSRGGALAVEYGAFAPKEKLPIPDTVLSVFPSGWGESTRELDLRPLDHRTTVAFMFGDDDTVVGVRGVEILVRRLQRAGFPGDRIRLHIVRSHGSFVANHFAPMETSPAARTEFWAPADGLLREIER